MNSPMLCWANSYFSSLVCHGFRYLRQKKLDDIRQINQGADFKQLAITNSDDQSALEGGDLVGETGATAKPIYRRSETFSLARYQTCRSGAGFHLLKLYDRKGGGEKLIEQHFSRHILLTPNEIRNEEKLLHCLMRYAVNCNLRRFYHPGKRTL